MAFIQITAERDIAAPAALVYDILADYREGHPSVLPPAFTAFEVLEGGIGAGTRIRFDLKLAGRTSTTTAVVTEPEPGRVLTETESERGLATSFTVEPIGSTRCHVTIDTVWQAYGIRAWVEKRVVPRLLRPLYEDQLERLETVSRARLTATHDSAPGD